MTSELTTLAPEDIIKPHAHFDQSKVKALGEAMYENGWQGRPLLAVEVMGNVQAITGTHRLLAACEELYEVPVYLISEEDWREAGFEVENIMNLNTDIERREFFEQLGNTEAAAIYEQEAE